MTDVTYLATIAFTLLKGTRCVVGRHVPFAAHHIVDVFAYICISSLIIGCREGWGRVEVDVDVHHVAGQSPSGLHARIQNTLYDMKFCRPSSVDDA